MNCGRGTPWPGPKTAPGSWLNMRAGTAESLGRRAIMSDLSLSPTSKLRPKMYCFKPGPAGYCMVGLYSCGFLARCGQPSVDDAGRIVTTSYGDDPPWSWDRSIVGLQRLRADHDRRLRQSIDNELERWRTPSRLTSSL